MRFLHHYHQRGQGLIETLIVFLFISVSVVALTKFQRYLSYSSELTHQQGDANLIAINQLETLRDFTVLTVTAGYTAYTSIVTSTGTSTIGNTTYTITSTVTTTATPSYKNLSVTVGWTDRYGVANSVVLITNVAGANPGGAAAFM